MMLKVRSYGFLFLLILPAVISACSKDWRNDGQAGDLVPISFSCGASPSVTVKAGASFAASNQLIANQHFAVYGWDTEDDFFFDGGTGPGAPDFWNGTTPMDVTFHDNEDRGKNNTYIIEAPLDMMARYWPRSTTPAYCYTFWAYYPYFSGNGIDVRSYSDPSYTDGTVGIFDFAVQSTPAAMVDF